MKAEVISIGTELTTGQSLDTNSQWLSRRLCAMGIPVHFHTTLADDLAENVQALAIARDRADLVIVTGGLGPTQDDLTRDALARLAGVELVFHQASFDYIRHLFASRKREMPERNRVQAMFPAGSEPIANSEGTAPGIWMLIPKPGGTTLFVALPGVPREMHLMFDAVVQPRLHAWAGPTGVVVERRLNTFGAGESVVEAKIMDLTRRDQVPLVGITASDAAISLRILAQAATAAEADRIIAPVADTLRARLGDLVYGEGDDELHDVVARLLMDMKLTIAVAESLTGGLVGYRLTLVPGVSASFLGGVCAYDNRIKRELLGVPAETLERHGAVSAETAEAMAAGCRVRFGSDLALSTTGIAGPDGGSEAKPVGTVHVGLAWVGGVTSRHFLWFGSRAEIQSRTAKMALNLLRLHLLGKLG